MKRLMMNLSAITLLVLTLGGCAMFSPEAREKAPISMPEKFSLYTEADTGPGKWWQAFGSKELDAMVEEALTGNFDIRTALANVKQAEAEAEKAGANLSPTVGYNGGAEVSRRQTDIDAESSSTENSQAFNAGFSAIYEVDLWGRLEALHTSELLTYQATREELDAAAYTVATDVVNSWIDILSVRQEITILEKQIEINKRILALQELRFINGRADTLDLSQQKEALAKSKAILPTLMLKEEQGRNALAILLGRAGKGDISIARTELPDLIPLPKTGLPADLLASRPDIRAAGLRLKAADWQVSAARADRLPSLTLSADAVLSSSSLDLLFSNWVSSLAASITGPLFDAGAKSAEVDRMRAEADKYLTAYAGTVAEAVREVEDGLVAEKRRTEYIGLLKDQLEASRLTVKDAHLQYLNGKDNYLDYLSSWTSVQSLERQLVEEEAALLKNRVVLYKTLGGDWGQKLSASVSK